MQGRAWINPLFHQLGTATNFAIPHRERTETAQVSWLDLGATFLRMPLGKTSDTHLFAFRVHISMAFSRQMDLRFSEFHILEAQVSWNSTGVSFTPALYDTKRLASNLPLVPP